MKQGFRFKNRSIHDARIMRSDMEQYTGFAGIYDEFMSGRNICTDFL